LVFFPFWFFSLSHFGSFPFWFFSLSRQAALPPP
jgi:hypothetical protein